MAAGFTRTAGETRRYPTSASSTHSTRLDNSRLQMPQILCRNGPQCRKFQEGTCHYNHDFTALAPNGLSNSKKSLSADSPSFTPKVPDVQAVKQLGISPTTAAAAIFTPRGSGSATPATVTLAKEPVADFIPSPKPFQPSTAFSEFVPGQNFLPQQPVESQISLQNQLANYGDALFSHQVQQSVGGLEAAQTQLNPYAQAAAVPAQAYYSDTSAYQHPLKYHLYAAVGPKREKTHLYQRSTSDFFINDELRENLQRKSEAALQIFANSTLPQSVEYFHSLVALDTKAHKDSSFFGLPTSIYKAVSSKDGRLYALRRVEGFRLTNEAAVRTAQVWKQLNNANMVKVYDIFTGRWFGDSSLIFVTDYHPLAQTVAEKFLPIPRQAPGTRSNNNNNNNSHSNTTAPSEQDLWGYIVQMANALHTIHEAGLAAQTVKPSKVLITSKNRLRLNCCGVLDVVRYEHKQPLSELQRNDLADLGRLVLAIANRNPLAHQNLEKSQQQFSRTYSDRLRACVNWLLNPPDADTATNGDAPPVPAYTVNTLLESIADKVLLTMDNSFQNEDHQTHELMRELENARLVRLLTKLNIILERPDTTLTPTGTTSVASGHLSNSWSETGERYYLKLFRDYVFHQVDQEGRPNPDLGHIITCLNKLDAGLDERVQLVSRDEQNLFMVTYREIKRGLESAWAEISKAATAASRR